MSSLHHNVYFTQGGGTWPKNSRQEGIWGIIHGQDGEGGAEDALPWK